MMYIYERESWYFNTVRELSLGNLFRAAMNNAETIQMFIILLVIIIEDDEYYAG